MIPTDKSSFKDFCLRKLGAPVITINVEDNQVDDRVDEALSFWTDFHYDGTEKTYYVYALTQQDIDNKYITLPSNIIGAVDLFPISDPITTSANMFNVKYQIMLNDLWNLMNVSIVPFYMMIQHLDVFEEILVGKQPIRYNRKDNKLYLDMDWTQVTLGEFIAVLCYQSFNPNDSNTAPSSVWSDRMLQKLATAYIKKNWGENLIKFAGMQLPGNVQFNGQLIYQEGVRESQQVEQDIMQNYGPVLDIYVN